MKKREIDISRFLQKYSQKLIYIIPIPPMPGIPDP
jgi:hypothetical protein